MAAREAMFSRQTLSITSKLLDELLGNRPIRAGEEVPANIVEAIAPDLSDEEAFEELVVPRIFPGIDEERLHIRVIETKVQSAQNKFKKSSDAARSDLRAFGCYNSITKKVRLQLKSNQMLKPIAQRLFYQGNQQPKSLVRDVTDANFKSTRSRLLEIDINEVLHVFYYNTFTLFYKYQLVGQKGDASYSQKSCFESEFQFEVRAEVST